MGIVEKQINDCCKSRVCECDICPEIKTCQEGWLTVESELSDECGCKTVECKHQQVAFQTEKSTNQILFGWTTYVLNVLVKRLVLAIMKASNTLQVKHGPIQRMNVLNASV